jgi:hypothetical protein
MVSYKDINEKGSHLTVCVPLVGEQRGCASGWQSPDSWGPLVEEHRGASAG